MAEQSDGSAKCFPTVGTDVHDELLMENDLRCLLFSSQSFFVADGSFRYETAPFKTVCSGVFPCTGINAELIERHLESVLALLSLTSG